VPTTRSSAARRGRGQATHRRSAALDLREDDETIVRHRLLTHDGEPVELSWSYCPVAIAAGSAVASRGKIPGEAPQALVDLGFPERTFEDRLSVRLPTNWMP
jgi:GntR family transcriptional regulator